MSHWDAFGYLAAGLVLAAFGMKEMIPLRIVAMCSNLAFIAYGLGLDLTPVWLLHAGLLPLNGWRLAEALRFPARVIRVDTTESDRHHPARKPDLFVVTSDVTR
jgi:CRP/FNR family transcriptional regulator, cyclic AMP receptor protein